MLRRKLICGAVLMGLLGMVATTSPVVVTAEAASFTKQKVRIPWTSKRPAGSKWLPPSPCRRACRR
jgi:hypothetical protein